LRAGGLIPNPLVSAGDGPPVRLDMILAGRAAVLTARQPDAELAGFCRRHRLLLVLVSGPPGTRHREQASPDATDEWASIRLTCPEECAALRALVGNPALAIIVRPDRVLAAVELAYRVPRLPWHVPAATVPPTAVPTDRP
jgi:hypothetical protein